LQKFKAPKRRRVLTAGVYVNTSKQVGDKDHLTFLETLEMNAV
jgi:hypothetical protein